MCQVGSLYFWNLSFATLVFLFFCPQVSAQDYTSCAPERFGSRCEGKCACSAIEDCNDGLGGDGSCTCALGHEAECGFVLETEGLPPILNNVSGLGRSSELIVTNFTLKTLRVDREGRKHVRQVFNASVSRVRPTRWKSTSLRLALLNPQIAKRVGLNPEMDDEERNKIAEIFSGRRLLAGSMPFAHAYGGHQFGSWAGQLGDGRAMSLGDVYGFTMSEGLFNGPRDWLYEVSLKGAGKTPYSRGGDGRAALANAAREFFAPVFLEAVGVPVTGTLCVVASDGPEDRIARDEWYDGKVGQKRPGIVTRVSPSFLRFGSFQLAAKRQGVKALEEIARFALATISRMEASDDGSARFLGRLQTSLSQWHKQECFFAERVQPSCASKHAELHGHSLLKCFFERVSLRTASLMAAWMATGFAHGVMNTDNLSVLGITLDLNVFGFIANFDLQWAPNHIDDERRYAFGKQQEIARWNLRRLADALTGETFSSDREPDAKRWMKVDSDGWLPASEVVGFEKDFDDHFNACYNARMRARLGLSTKGVDSGSDPLVDAWVSWLSRSGADYPRASRGLAEIGDASIEDEAAGLAADAGASEASSVALKTFLSHFLEEQKKQTESEGVDWRDAIRNAVPSSVPRSHILREAARFTEMENAPFLKALYIALSEPFDNVTRPLGVAWDDVQQAWKGVKLSEEVDIGGMAHWLQNRLGALPMRGMQQLQTSCGAQ